MASSSPSNSPTPAVLPDARASLEQQAHEWRKREVQAIGAAISNRSWPGVELAYNVLRDKMDRAGCWNAPTATPPASDAAVPAGETREGCVGTMDPTRAAYFLERFKREEKMLGPHEQWALDYTIAMLAAAPKVASDTGAGLREALVEAREIILELIHAHDCQYEGTDAEMVGFIDAALSTPTDATDGATGNLDAAASEAGEVERLRRALMEITALRPLGNVQSCKQPRVLVEQMERIALCALDGSPLPVFERAAAHPSTQEGGK
jgi:hypothetical protein